MTSERPTHRCEGCGEWLSTTDLVPPGDGHVVSTHTEHGTEAHLCGPVRPQHPPSPLVTDADVDDTLLRRLQEAEVTGRHLRSMSGGKQAARADGAVPWAHGLSMVEAIILWWETGVRGEVLGEEGPVLGRGQTDST